LATVLPTYDSITNKELREVAAKYFDFDRAAVVWAVPAGAGKGAKAKAGKRAKRGKGAEKAKAKGVPKVAKGKAKAGKNGGKRA
jgi:hypothetical protein